MVFPVIKKIKPPMEIQGQTQRSPGVPRGLDRHGPGDLRKTASKVSGFSRFDCGATGRTSIHENVTKTMMAGWWFGTCFIFPYIGHNHLSQLTNIFQRG